MPGEFPEVVGGDTATAARQNDVQHRMVNHFANEASRDSLWPNPPEGSVCWIDSNNQLQVFDNVTWRELLRLTIADTRYLSLLGGVITGLLQVNADLGVTGTATLGDTTMEKAENVTILNDGDTKLRNITIGIAPGTAITGDLWVDTIGLALKRWSGATWDIVLQGV